MAGLTADQEREQVAEIRRARAENPHRVYVGPLTGVRVDGEPVVPASREVQREEFGRRIAFARSRFSRRAA